MIRALVEELKPFAHDPGMFLRKLNSDLFTILKNTGSPILTTAFYLVANCQTGVMRFANAGHPKPLHIRRGRIKSNCSATPPVKASPRWACSMTRNIKPPKPRLNRRPRDALHRRPLRSSRSRTRNCIPRNGCCWMSKVAAQKPVAPLFDELLDSIRAFSIDHEFEDDVCLVGMEFASRLAQKKS